MQHNDLACSNPESSARYILFPYVQLNTNAHIWHMKRIFYVDCIHFSYEQVWYQLKTELFLNVLKTETYCGNIFKIFSWQVRSNFDKQRRRALLTPLHFITSSLDLNCKGKVDKLLPIPESMRSSWSKYMPKIHTFLTRSFNCFLPCSIRNPGVFGDETLITWNK